MFRTIIISGITVLSLAVYSLFYIKYQVIELAKNVEYLKKEVSKEKETIYILRAENTFLSKPARIRKLATKYLSLEPTKIAQLTKPQSKDVMSKDIMAMDEQPKQKLIKWRYKKNIGSNISTIVMKKGK